jgi:hypothetical protein
MTTEREKKKQPTIKTLEDKGTKIDYVDFGDGRQAFFYQTEKFRGVSAGAFRFGWTDKYNVISPSELSKDTIAAMSASASTVTGSPVKPEDFKVFSADAHGSFTIGAKAQAEVKKKKE